MIELKITAESAAELAEQLKGLTDVITSKTAKKQEPNKVIQVASNTAPKEELNAEPPKEEKLITKAAEPSDAKAHPILAELAKSKSMVESYELLVAKQIEVSKMLTAANLEVQAEVKAAYECSKNVEVGANFATAFLRSWYPTFGVTVLKELKGIDNTPENVEKYVKAYDEYVKLITFISKA